MKFEKSPKWYLINLQKLTAFTEIFVSSISGEYIANPMQPGITTNIDPVLDVIAGYPMLSLQSLFVPFSPT